MRVSVRRLVASIAGLAVAVGGALFLPAGTPAWPAGWAFLVLFLGFVVALSLWLLRFNPDLPAERMTGVGRPDQRAWDKVFFALMQVAFFAWLAVLALDAVRFRWSQVPPSLQATGALPLVGSFYLFYRTFRENSYLSPAVRIQTERAQTAVSTGPYRYVRHPMYAAFVPFALGTALLLGSWYGLLGGPLLVGMIGWRAVQEERVRREGLEGGGAYMTRVRYRLIPYVS
jgi:protein-S-isoprenylcysteine O-methyltransferase Ste14